MKFNAVKVKYCLLGYGYASLVAYEKLLKTNKPEEILILQHNKASQIFTIEHDDIDFSPLPIFPVKESALYNSDLFKNIPNQEPITVRFSELENIELHALEVTKGSLADFMIKKQGVDRNLCLGLKQWGKKMLYAPLSQVQDKIKRHYISNGGNTRLGYINSKSLYAYAIEKLNPEILRFETLESIDIEKKQVYLDNQIIHYDNLISTVPLHYLLDLCDLPQAHNKSYAGAKFCFFTYDKGFDENQMIYDCDFTSDIIRVFSISDSLMLAQLGGSVGKELNISDVITRIKELVPTIENLEFARKLFLPMCYPLETIHDEVTLDSLSKLKHNQVLPFGRFGNWEYSDLHELDTTKVGVLEQKVKV